MLENLIAELFDEIVALLKPPDLYALRLASRHLEQKSRSAFSSLAFSDVTTDFSSASIQRLSCIGNSRLGPAVRRLHVGDWGDDRERLSRWGRDAPYGRGGYWPRLENGAVDPGSALVAEFSTAMSRFPNCAAATITDELVRIGGHPSNVGPERCLSSSDAAELVLRAYSVPGAPPLRSFRVLIHRGVDWQPKENITGATVASAQRALAGHLQELVFKSNGPETDDQLSLMLDLVTASQSLTILRLFCGCPVAREGYAETGFLLGRRLKGFMLPLEHLTLSGITMRGADLCTLLSQWSTTLETLAFHDTEISPGLWTSVLQHLHNVPFTRLRRFSMQRCLDGDRVTTAFCPLWKMKTELEKLCDCEFEFKYWRTNRSGTREFHVTGVLFEPRRGPPGMRQGLRAIMEYSHRPSVEPGVTPPCASDQEIRVCGLARDTHRGWTGLGPEYRSS